MPVGPETMLATAILCAGIADAKKARDVTVLEVGRFLVITEYFVIASGTSRKQIQAIADEILRVQKKAGVLPGGVEGYDEGRWILIDLGDVIVHLFHEETRRYYDLEFLWQDAPRLAWGPGVGA